MCIRDRLAGAVGKIVELVISGPEPVRHASAGRTGDDVAGPHWSFLLAENQHAVAGEDDEEEPLVQAAASDDLEEGMHAVEDDAEPVDFSEDADADTDDEDEDESGEPEPPKGVGAVNVPDRWIYCLDLRDHADHRVYVEEVRRIAARAPKIIAELRRHPDGSFELADVGSHGGTFVNGKRITVVKLTEQDVKARRLAFQKRHQLLTVPQPRVKHALERAFVAACGIARASGPALPRALRRQAARAGRFVDALAGGRVHQARGSAADHHVARADARPRQPAVQQVALLAHAIGDAREQAPLDRAHERVELRAQLRAGHLCADAQPDRRRWIVEDVWTAQERDAGGWLPCSLPGNQCHTRCRLHAADHHLHGSVRRIIVCVGTVGCRKPWTRACSHHKHDQDHHRLHGLPPFHSVEVEAGDALASAPKAHLPLAP